MTVKNDLTTLQNVVWNVAAAVEVVGIFAFLSRRVDTSDPVIAVFVVGILFTVAWLTRLWIRTSLPDEKLRRLVRR